MRFGPEDMTPPPEHDLNPSTAVQQPAQLQINQSGAWRAALDFNSLELPSEFLYHVDQMLRIAGLGSKGRARIVLLARNGRGGWVATSTLVNQWTTTNGWAGT